MSHPCPLMLDMLCPMEHYDTAMGVPYAEGPDDAVQEQRRLAESLVAGVEVEGEVQREQAQFQPQIEEVSHDDRRGRGTLYIQSRQAAYIPLF